MGTDKASLLWSGRSLLARAVDVVRSVTDTVTIVGNPSLHQFHGAPVICDRVCGAGPLAGIEAALAASVTPWNLIVACDMPTLDAKVLTAILDRANNESTCDAVVPISNGRPQPLCAAYHLRALPALQAALTAGTFKIMESLSEIRVGHIDVVDARPFRNVNTPEDWSNLVSEKSA